VSTIRTSVADHEPQSHRDTERSVGFRLCASVSLWPVVVCIAALLLAAPAEAQTRGVMLRGFGDVGATTFTAKNSFDAVLGSEGGLVFGGGIEAVLPQRVFVNVRASRFRDVGQRVFLFNGEQFDLGIPATVTVTPVELTGGYRFDVGWRVVPYGGAGLGWHRYEESSRFADASENVDERFTGYQVVGGAELRLARWIAAAAEAQWATVPGALGDDPNSVSHEFNESDLGGVTFRIKVVIGR
jgi:opacity protein-like surface antigen